MMVIMMILMIMLMTTVLPKPTTAVMVIEVDAVFIDFLKDGR